MNRPEAMDDPPSHGMKNTFRQESEEFPMSRALKCAALVALAIVLCQVSWSGRANAQQAGGPAALSQKSLKGRYVCRVDSDGQYEDAVVVLVFGGDGTITYSNKILVSYDFENCGAGNNYPCPCSQTLTSPSGYTVTGQGAFIASLNWTPGSGNDSVCDASTFPDTWTGTVTNGAKSILFADNNNGNEDENGTGQCTKLP
jgi:hypothetical protein